MPSLIHSAVRWALCLSDFKNKRGCDGGGPDNMVWEPLDWQIPPVVPSNSLGNSRPSQFQFTDEKIALFSHSRFFGSFCALFLAATWNWHNSFLTLQFVLLSNITKHQRTLKIGNPLSIPTIALRTCSRKTTEIFVSSSVNHHDDLSRWRVEASLDDPSSGIWAPMLRFWNESAGSCPCCVGTSSWIWRHQFFVPSFSPWIDIVAYVCGRITVA